MSSIYGNGVALTEKVLDYLWGRQNLTLNNIANVDTPGFKSQYASFEEEMADRISKASSQYGSARAVRQAIGNTRFTVHTTNSESMRLDGNNVDMEQEQVELVRTVYEYQYMTSSISNELMRLRSAVKTF